MQRKKRKKKRLMMMLKRHLVTPVVCDAYVCPVYVVRLPSLLLDQWQARSLLLHPHQLLLGENLEIHVKHCFASSSIL
jgi:hypothetical protein